MAQGNIIQGQGAGKVGDLVLMVRNGVQVARVYTKAGARSGSAASEASRIQRVRFGSASNQWSLYRYVCTRMYRKGKAGNLSDYNYFVKRNQTLLPYLTKQENSDGVRCVMPGQLSEGNLGRIEIVLQISTPTQAGASTYRISDAQHKMSSSVGWTARMSAVKAALAATYTSASKITYLFSFAPVVFTEGEGGEFESQTVRHTAVTIDLYKEAQTGENDLTLAQYVSARFADSDWGTLISSQTGSAMNSSTMLQVSGITADNYDLFKNMAVCIFATDETASDCYTTTVPADAVPPTNSAYALYFSYRTTEALRIACESYGYQSGVMRDDIAKFGNSLQQQVAAYAARLRSLGLAAETSEE